MKDTFNYEEALKHLNIIFKSVSLEICVFASITVDGLEVSTITQEQLISIIASRKSIIW